MPSLLDPIQVGDLHLPNRVFMAPLTRLRGTPDHIPTPMMIEYYTQRASAGLIISEGTPVDPMGVGYANVPGLWSQQQVEAWKPITAAVHNAGGHIFAQIWHVGRISDPEFLNGQLPVAPSAIAAQARSACCVRSARSSRHAPLKPARSKTSSRPSAAARRTRRLRASTASSSMEPTAISSTSFSRTAPTIAPTSTAARSRTARALCSRPPMPPSRSSAPDASACTSLRAATAHGISDSNPTATFSYVARELGRRKIAFIAAREHVGPDSIGPHLKQLFGGVFVANEAIDQKTGQQLLDEGKADAVAFGKLFIANPDLPARFAKHAPLNRPEPNTFYAPGPHGYIDYPPSADRRPSCICCRRRAQRKNAGQGSCILLTE